MKIKIKKSSNADTRTCDWTKVTIENLADDSKSHRKDVRKGMFFLAEMVAGAGIRHDYTKLTEIAQFHDDFKNGFKEGHQSWWKMHQEIERHHLKNPEYVQDDVTLVDVLEMIVDGVMAGMARSGEYRKEEISADLLQKAFDNTIKLLLCNVEVVE